MRIFLPLLWFAMAAGFLLVGSGDSARHSARPERVEIEASAISTAPPRRGLHDPPRVVIGGVEQKCSDCHALFASQEVTPSQVRQHTDIVFDHGINDRCLNCHAQEDRNRLVLHDGSRIGFSDSSILCSQCHGTLFRDWERGMHGRTAGSWDPESPDHHRLRCVDCHDPHRPAFDPIVPLPGPTRTAPEPQHDEGPSEAQLENPLERWKLLRDGQSRRNAAKGH